ncbi:hypothetical protein [Mycolicibacterium sediminis]|uniref:hypothetical protein n=1 Tax=Mycolicibacterium sediminis TaxID=1286180 RepID=UPI0013D3A8AE|nr:hypothetical protein [Mycolicibacterium sediminis]
MVDDGSADAWPGPRAGLKDHLATAVVLGIGVLSIVVGGLLATGGNTAALVYCLLFATAMALAAAFGVVIRRDRRELSSAVRTVAEGTEVRCAAAPFAILVALTSCFGILGVGAAIQIGVSGLSALLGAVGLFFASFGVAAAMRRLQRGGITLSESGISQRGWSFESRLDWSAVAGIERGFHGHPVIMVFGYANADWDRRHTTVLWRIDRLPPAPMIEVDCRRFDVNPSGLLSFLRTYVDEPDTRVELGTELALARARARRRTDGESTPG